jgi:hypothetical protein
MLLLSFRYMKNQLLVISCLLIFYTNHAQTSTKDLKDVFREMKKHPEAKLTNDLTVGKTYISVLPVIGYGPANGFVVGSAVSFARLFGNPPTNLSSGMLNCQITSKRQFIVNTRSKIYLSDNKWFLQGDWRLLIFTQPTYGLGINNSGVANFQLYVNNLAETEDSKGEPMKFNLIRVYEDVSRRLGDSYFYAGLGLAVDQHFDIVDERLNTETDSPAYYITSNYAYSLKNNFNPGHYGTNGLKFTLLTDTRDNISNCYKGYFASISLLCNVKIGTNSQQSTQLLYDGRYYLGLSSRNPRHLIAFWSWGSILLNGNVPYLALPSIGWDTYNRSGRGYVQGRYRGLSMLYNEAEYRFPISNNGMFGGIVFLNATTASNYSSGLFNKTALGFGTGFRLQLDKLARTNLTVDVGMGTDHSGAIYFNLQETF